MPTIKKQQPKLPKLKQPKALLDEDLVNSDPSVKEIGEERVRFENEQAKKHPYTHDPKAKTTEVKASGVVIYNY